MKKAPILVAANVVVAVLVVLFVFAILSALSAFAAYVTTWPLFVLLGVGVVLTGLSIGALRKTGRGKKRLAGNMLNGAAGALYAILISYFAWSYLTTTRERFVIPQGYQGEVYVVHGVSRGAPAERSFYKTVTYRIPGDGVLLSQVPMDMHGTRPEYFYQTPNGALNKITNAWYSTIQDTPENRANTKDVGMFFPRTAYGGDHNYGCDGPSDLFTIGTPSFLLSHYHQIDISGYLKAHADICAKY